MNAYVVLYRIESIMAPTDEPFGFECYADDTDHAEEQCVNAYPDADVVWVYEGIGSDDYQDALDDYYQDALDDYGDNTENEGAFV